MSELCAAIDFGTNTARLLIGRRTPHGLTTLHVERQVVRLGGGFTDSGGLSAEAQQRGLDCLKRFAEIIKEYAVPAVRASATSAVRDAVNGPAFVETVFKETGITLTVIDGDMEGLLTLKGVIAGLDSVPANMLVLDVGGGSTEFTVVLGGEPKLIRSLPLGVVRLTEGFKTEQAMRDRISLVMSAFLQEMSLADICVPPDCVFIATAGTATTLAAIQLEMVEYDYRRVNNYLIQRPDITRIYQQLLPLQPHERLAVKGLEKGREDLIMAGSMIIMSTMDLFVFNEMKVSDYGLLEGLALSEDFKEGSYAA
ncbi:MAG TPA: exopolyphosphatase [Desulfuromonadales bacterium]|nr:exopolyphosphatase [Desulfuromonadales bacterium]